LDRSSEKGQVTWQERWEDSKGMLLILCSEFFETDMAAAARLLEMGGSGMGTLQVCFSFSLFIPSYSSPSFLFFIAFQIYICKETVELVIG